MLELQVGGYFRKYELRKLLGRGSVGVVWEAFDPLLEQRVALKFLDPESEERLKKKKFELRESFLGEARALGKLRPTTNLERSEAVRVAQVFDADVDENSGLFYIAQEFVDGVTLADVLKTRWNSLSRRKQELLMRNVVKSVRYAHDRGVPHGDISLSNFLVEDSLNARLVDFGMSSLGIPSSILYLAPELIGGGNRSFESDAWSLGVVLYRMTYGKFPFRLERASAGDHDAAKSSLDDVVKTAEEYAELCRKVREDGPHGAGRGLFPMVQNCLGRLLEKDPSKRCSVKKALWYAHDGNSLALKSICGLCATVSMIAVAAQLVLPPRSVIVSVRPTESVVDKTDFSPLINGVSFLRRSWSYDLKCSPKIWERSPDGKYVLYSDEQSWYLFDVASGGSLALPVSPSRKNSFVMGESGVTLVDMSDEVRSFSYTSPFEVFSYERAQYANPLRGMSLERLRFAKQLCAIKEGTVLCLTAYTLEGYHNQAGATIPLVESRKTLDAVVPAPQGEGESVYIWSGGKQYFFENVWGKMHSGMIGSEKEFPKRLEDLPVLTVTLFLKKFSDELYGVKQEGVDGVYDGVRERFFPLPECSQILSAFLHNKTVYAVALREDKTGDGVVDVRDGQLFRIENEKLIPVMPSRGAFLVGRESR